jgi:AcrR family transcriptional regulator
MIAPEMPQQQAAIALSPKIRRRQGRTRQRILDESARLFIAKGFENVSVEEIIAAAEIARSSFYRFFSNREEVLANIIRPVFEQGIVELDAIGDQSPETVMHGIFAMYLTLWKMSPDSLRISTRVGGVYFYLFEDIHTAFRQKLGSILRSIESSGIYLNGSADNTGRIIARTVVSVLEVYADADDFEQLFRQSMSGFLLNPEVTS